MSKKIKIKVADLNDIPEELQGFYAEMEGGGYMLQAEADADGFGIGNIASLRGKLDKALAKNEKQQALLLEKEDGTLWTREELETMSSEVDSLRKAVQEGTGAAKDLESEVQLRTADLKKQFGEQVNTVKSENERLRKMVNDGAVDREVAKVIAEMKVKPEWVPLMTQELRRHITVEEVDGNIRTRFVNPDDGNSVRYSSQQFNDGPMDFSEFSKHPDIREKYAQCLVGDGKVGAADVSQRSASNGRDVVLSKEEYENFATFSRAKELAQKQGGQVLMKD